MPQRLAPLARGIDGDLQPCVDVALADHVLHPLGAQVAVVIRRFGFFGFEDRFAHAALAGEKSRKIPASEIYQGNGKAEG